jgi:hypothetical protein
MHPQKHTMARAALALCVGIAVAASAPAAAQGKDDQWEITSKMEMPGMPMAMPAQVNRICVAKGAKDEDYIPRQGNCRMTDNKRTGNKFTYRMECTGSDAATMDGEVVFGTGAYEGKMKMTMAGSSQAMQMTYSGQRTGSCTAPAK